MKENNTKVLTIVEKTDCRNFKAVITRHTKDEYGRIRYSLKTGLIRNGNIDISWPSLSDDSVDAESTVDDMPRGAVYTITCPMPRCENIVTLSKWDALNYIKFYENYSWCESCVPVPF